MSNYTIELNDEEYEAIGALLHFGLANLQRLVGTITAPEKDEPEEPEGSEEEEPVEEDPAEEQAEEEVEESGDPSDEEYTLDSPSVVTKLAPYGFSRQALYRMVGKGTLPAPKRISGRFYWKPQEIEDWIKEHPLVRVQPARQEEQS